MGGKLADAPDDRKTAAFQSLWYLQVSWRGKRGAVPRVPVCLAFKVASVVQIHSHTDLVIRDLYPLLNQDVRSSHPLF